MHLLNTTTKQLKSFYGKNIPKYAILSHMWGGEEDEVLFKHIAGSDDNRREGEGRKGYAKLVGACKQANEDGWEYIWIDTCCINKESSAELSEAINSMYAWYQKSEACYVYLEDVQISGSDQNSFEDTRSDEEDEDNPFKIVPFECSRWFSRGWTLQELIAPRYVVFYSKDWVDIGTKTSLRDTISAVTRIRVEMLMEYDPKKASVAERMSWAAFRETTRDEDTAYCLMGLFGVNMPLLYGEGNKAFRRLQEEIMKDSDDHSLFAWKTHFNYNRIAYEIQGFNLDSRRTTRPMHSETRGLLADSPWNFRDGTDIVPSKDGAYSPYSMTNQGLQIKLPLQPIDPKRDLIDINTTSSTNIFKTTLKCTLRNKEPTRWIVIYLKMIREGYYARVFSHWLDETEANPNKTYVNELASLLVPQIDTSTFYNGQIEPVNGIDIKVLPTESGFTVDGHSLVNGYNYPYTVYNGFQVIFFYRQDRRFGVVIGSDNGIPWLDVIDVVRDGEWGDEIESSYKKGGSRYIAQIRRLDRLSVKIPGGWSVTVSVRKTGHSRKDSHHPAIIDIQGIPENGGHNPSLISNTDGFDNDFPGDFDHHNVRPGSKKEGSDWFAIFNPKAKRVFDVNLLRSFMHESSVYCTRFSPDGKYLAAGCCGTTRVYDTDGGAETCTLIDENEILQIHSLCFSFDGKFLATGDDDAQIKLWNIKKRCIRKVFTGHRNVVQSLCFSSDGRLIVSGSGDGTVRIWNVTGETSTVLNMSTKSLVSVRSVAISPNGRLIAAGGTCGTIRIWNITTTQLLKSLRRHGENVHSVVFTLDEKGLVAGGTHCALEYQDVSRLVTTEAKGVIRDPNSVGSGNGSRSLPALTQTVTDRPDRRAMAYIGHKSIVSSASVSQDGNWVISVSPGDHLQFWDLKNETAQFMLRERVNFVNISPVGNIFATSNRNGRVRIWRYDAI